MSNKIVRSICTFSKGEVPLALEKLDKIADILVKNGYEVQTRRICFEKYAVAINDREFGAKDILLGMGPIQPGTGQWKDFLVSDNKSVYLDLTESEIDIAQAEVLFEIIRKKPGNTFNFTYGFNIPDSSPYFPSARFGGEGFSIGLQPTDLSEGCNSLDEWLEQMKSAWEEISKLVGTDPMFLGIDSSIAPIFDGTGSLINFIRRLGMSFSQSVTTDIYTQITRFIKEKNPKPVGLCGLMFPCLEDFELAEEYEMGNFSVERNIFASLHSGLGIDTYPIGIDEQPERVVQILRLVQALSNKYKKPLSVRFVSDGKAQIGERTDFRNQYLKDVAIRPL